jgi:hypothetical protein
VAIALDPNPFVDCCKRRVRGDRVARYSEPRAMGGFMAYWVTGGEYEDAKFARLRAAEERYGPFPDFAAARREWQARTMATIDNALVRYLIVEERDQS